ncbi:Retrovirus-related Pol polyprotein from transposon [Smittium culicis]|uniref:Retrovirus-related Pol polyprotein from transposon n=1 Tax=Smittium culicis TaxID=133412 RepID=A0A1R1XW62_9FUNG|nr:Retrovirus-related Pol polyprotein from transposon [Smittium culicis]
MNDNTMQLSAGQFQEAEMSYSNFVAENEQLKTQLAAAESQYNQLAAENETLKGHNDKLASENTELKIPAGKAEIVTREKQLAIKEADFYRRQVEIASAQLLLPLLRRRKCPRYLSFVLTDFNHRMIVVESLKEDARAWYDTEPDTSTTSWEALKDALLRQYGGTNSIANALQTINIKSKASYDPTTMTISFAKNDKIDTFKMVPSELKATEWAPLVLAASAVDCLPKADPGISAILRDVASLFDPTPSIINTDFPHQLRLTTDQPAHARMRRYSPEEARVLREHVKELYEAGYARPSTSPYSANPLIVPKADGTPRVVINFRPLNKITIRDEYLLPRIDVILNQIFGCCFYSKLDVLKGFYQIPLHPDSIEASAFSTPDGHCYDQ